MFKFLKITQNKIKLFVFFLCAYFIFAFLCDFLASIIIKELNPQMQIDIIIQSFQILNLFIVSYILLVSLKKEFFIKKYFISFIKIFSILFVSEKLFAVILFLSFKIIPAEIYFSNAFQIIGLMSGCVIYYIAICYMDSLIGK